MAGTRQVEFDLLVSGTEVGGRKLERLADKFDDVSNSVDRLDGKTARVRGIAKMEKDTDRLGDKVAVMAGKMLSATASVVRFTSFIAVAAGAVGPLALAVGAAVVSVAQFTAAVAPAAAALLPLAAGAAFVQLTFKGMGEEFLKSVEPMTAAWEKQTKAAGRLATQGLRPIAREFVRVNFPAIAAAQERIARSTNRVVTGFGKWVNSAPGIKVIRTLTSDAAESFEKLAPSIRGVAQSLLLLAGRVSGVSFSTFTALATEALGQLTRFIDRLGADDVNRAFYKIREAAHAAAEGLRAVVGAVQWLEANRQKILAFSDALLVMGGVGAALVGGPAGWLAALGAGLILLARHWDEATAAIERGKAALTGVRDRFSSIQGTLDSFSVFWASVLTGFREFTAEVGPRIAPMLERIQTAFIKAQPLIAAVTTVLGGFAKAMFEIAGPVLADFLDAVGLMASFMGNLALGAAMAGEKILNAFVAIFQPIATLAKKLKLPFADAFQSFVDGSRNAAARINTSMAQVKTDLAQQEISRLQRRIDELKGKTVVTQADRNEIRASQERIRALQATIDRTHGKNVFVSVTTTFKARGSPTSGFGGGGLLRASGGPVQKGRPYIVGEHRRELFVPRETGRIENKVPTGWDGGGRGGGTTIITVNAPNYVGDKRDLVKALDDLNRRGRLPKAS